MLHTRSLAGAVDIGGQHFVWELRREPQWCTADGWKGMVVAIRHRDGQREALLQFPMPGRSLRGTPQRQRPQVNPAIIANGVRTAIADGWEPLSRGKPETFLVDANGLSLSEQ